MLEIYPSALSNNRAVRDLLITFAHKEKISYFDLRRRENTCYSIYDNGSWCGCTLVSFSNSGEKALCIFNSTLYCTDENHTIIMDAIERFFGSRPVFTELACIDGSYSHII